MSTLERVSAALATPDGFRAWLVQSGPAVFTACASNDCPLAEYIESLGDDILDVEVLGEQAWWWEPGPDGDERMCPLSSWAQRFVTAIDESVDQRLAPIKATEALAVLDQVMGRTDGL